MCKGVTKKKSPCISDVGPGAFEVEVLGLEVLGLCLSGLEAFRGSRIGQSRFRFESVWILKEISSRSSSK